MKTRTILFLSLAALASASCGNRAAEEPQATAVQTISIKDTTCTVDYFYPATLSGITDVAVYPMVSGRITDCKVTEGQRVSKGQVLFEICDIPYAAAVESAKAQVEVSRAQLETARLTCQSKKNLLDKGIISEYQYKLAENEVATAQAVLSQSQAELRKANLDLSFTKVRAANPGLVGQLPFKVGSLVGPSMPEPLTVVSDNSVIVARISLSESAALALGVNTDAVARGASGTPCRLVTNLGAEYPYEGRIASVSGVISEQTGSVSVRIEYPNPDRVLLSGGSAKVKYIMKYDHAFLVPRASLKEIQDKFFLFVVRDGVLAQTEVRAERLDSSNWLLLPDEDGSYPVKEGDRITATTNRMYDGETVTIAE